MPKLHLEIDALSVETFPCAPAAESVGTVAAHQDSIRPCMTEMTVCFGLCGNGGTLTATQPLFTNNDDTCYYTAGPWDTCQADCNRTWLCETTTC